MFLYTFMQPWLTPNLSPMQIGFTHATSEERERRIRNHLCLYCSQPGYLRASCPTRPSARSSSTVSSNHCSLTTLEVSVTLMFHERCIDTRALIDSGAAGNLIDLKFAKSHHQFSSISGLPFAYHDLAVAFSKTKASQLPPHQDSDCAIDLLPGSPSRGRVIPLSQPESEAMKAFIEEELSKGFIRPSTSPTLAGFFFDKKKDEGLHSFIDYCSLNDTV